MKVQSSVILSIGSNQGDRHAAITNCIQHIHMAIATVVKVSGIYQTPAWGFTGDDFYNCAIILHTVKPAAQLLEELLQAEQHLGRQRTQQEGYQPRNIDIDIVSYDDTVINSEALTIPHPRLQNRNFVLYPLRDVAPHWQHPVLHKTIEELIRLSPDDSSCTLVHKVASPLDISIFSGQHYIAIEGNIGAGKTTLATKIAEDFNAGLILERFAGNPFLPKFYKDQPRYAFALETSFLADRYQQLSDDLDKYNLQNDLVIADYHIIKSLVFSKVTLDSDEFDLYSRLFAIMYKETPRPGLLVYLYQDTQKLLQQIKQRGREYEQDIQPGYLNDITKGYLDYIKNHTDLNVLMINVSGRDFVKNQQDYIRILEQIGDFKEA